MKMKIQKSNIRKETEDRFKKSGVPFSGMQKKDADREKFQHAMINLFSREEGGNLPVLSIDEIIEKIREGGTSYPSDHFTPHRVAIHRWMNALLQKGIMIQYRRMNQAGTTYFWAIDTASPDYIDAAGLHEFDDDPGNYYDEGR
jgi:hypothetical protein